MGGAGTGHHGGGYEFGSNTSSGTTTSQVSQRRRLWYSGSDIRGSRWRWPRLLQRCSAFPAGLRNFRQAVRLPSLCYPIFPTDSLRPAPAMEHPPRARRWRGAGDGWEACILRNSGRRHAGRAAYIDGRVPVPPAAVWQELGGAAPRDYPARFSETGARLEGAPM